MIEYLDGNLTDLTKPPPFNIRICEECREPYGWVPHDSGRKPRFCASCRFVVTARTHRICMYKYPRTCVQCGISFLSRRKEGLYCSKKCHVTYRYRNGKVELKCATCGDIFKTCVAGSRRSKHIYCSRECMWAGKIKDLPRTNVWGSVRKWFSRYGRMKECARCKFSDEPGILVIHHKDRNRDNNKLDNLEVLCPNCHAREHLKENKEGWQHKSVAKAYMRMLKARKQNA